MTPTPAAHELLTVAEVARSLRCGPQLVRKLLASGALAGFRLGSWSRAEWRVTLAALDAYRSATHRCGFRRVPQSVCPRVCLDFVATLQR